MNTSILKFNLTYSLIAELSLSLKQERKTKDYQNFVERLFLYLSPIILILGTFGNLFSFFIFTKLGHINLNFLKKKTKQAATRHEEQINRSSGLTIYVYLSILALYDLGVLYFGLLNEWVYLVTLFSLKNRWSILCKLFTFMAYLCSHCSSSLILLTNFIRFLALYSPMRASNLTTLKSVEFFNIIILLAIILFNSNLFWNIELKKKEQISIEQFLERSWSNVNDYHLVLKESLNKSISSNDYECSKVDNVFMAEYWPILDKLLYCVVPFIFVTIFNILIFRNLSQLDKGKTILYAAKSKQEDRENHSVDLEKLLIRNSFKAYYNNLSKSLPTLNQAIKSKHLTPNIRQEQRAKHNKSRRVPLKEAISDCNNTPQCSNTLNLNSNSDNNQIKEEIIKLKKFHLISKRFTVMLFGMSTAFLCLTLPVVVIYVLLETIKNNINKLNLIDSNKSYEWLEAVVIVSRILMYLNHSVNFFIYFLTSARFRQQFYNFFDPKTNRFVGFCNHKIRKMSHLYD
jgi:hypothetical protein